MESKSKIATLVVITIYKERGRVPELLQAISLQNQPVSTVLIIDNSPEPVFHDAMLFDLASKFPIVVAHKPENIGVSGAINFSVEWAKERAFQFIWLMDHDSIPSPDCHGLLVTALEVTDYAALAACQPVIEPQSNHLHGLIFQKYRFVPIIPSLTNSAWYECDAVITSGSLLSIPRISRLKIVDESLFIDAVDYDLCWRIRSAGLKIVVVKDAIMSHQLGTHKLVRDQLKKRMIQLSSYSHLRLYYICRNHTYVEIKAAQGLWKLVAILWRVRFCLWQIRMNQLEGEQALKKSIFCLLGLIDGLLGRTGKHPLSSPPSSNAKYYSV